MAIATENEILDAVELETRKVIAKSRAKVDQASKALHVSNPKTVSGGAIASCLLIAGSIFGVCVME